MLLNKYVYEDIFLHLVNHLICLVNIFRCCFSLILMSRDKSQALSSDNGVKDAVVFFVICI